MKTKIAATFVALACVASIGLPAAAADDASNAWTQSAATATPVQPRPETSGQFTILSNVTAAALSSNELASTRGTYHPQLFNYTTYVGGQGSSTGGSTTSGYTNPHRVRRDASGGG